MFWLFAQEGVVPGAEEELVTELITSFIVLLLVATAVALITRRLKMPYVTGLVLAGLAITKDWLPGDIGIDPALVLNLFLPILIFESAINTDISRLRTTFRPIALLAGPGLVLAAAITAFVLKIALNLELNAALFAGAILAITDTVSVIAAFKEISVPSRLSTIVEGESLFNDGVALVILSVVGEVYAQGGFDATAAFQQLFLAIVGGTVVGLGLGYLCLGLFRQLDDPLSSLLLTVAVSLGTFQVAQFLEVSGAVAVVVSGLVVGNIGVSREVSASTKITLLSFWEYAGFGVNTFIFLLIGIEVDVGNLIQTLPFVLIAVISYQAGRAISIYPLLALLQFFGRPIPLKWQHVLFLGNVKGSLSMALASSLPTDLPGREQLITLIFGTVLVSLIGQGLSLPWLVSRLKLTSFSKMTRDIEARQLDLITSKAAQEELDNLHKTGVLPKAVYEEIRANYQARIAKSERQLRDLYNRRSDPLDSPAQENDKFLKIRRQLLLAEKGAINDSLRKGILSEELARSSIQDINQKLLQLEDD
ncbi:MAG: cation:proton antiporter [Halothece sp.]